MAVLRFKVPLSEEALAYLNEIIAGEKDSPTPGHWLFANAIKPRVKETAETRNLIRARGTLKLPSGKELTPTDMDIGPLESFPDGTVEIIISERVKGWIEESAGYISAVNRLQDQKLSWSTPAEWVREVCLGAIATATAKLDDAEWSDEEKALYDPKAEKKAPTAPSSPPAP